MFIFPHHLLSLLMVSQVSSLIKKNVGMVLKELTSEYGQLGQLIFDNQGALPAHINIYVNNQEINSLDGLETILEDGDQVAIIPALSGGKQ